MAGGAARPVTWQTDEDAGPVTDDIAEGPVAGGRCEACGMAGDEDASVGPITAGCMPVACAAGPITEGAKRRMSQTSLSACLTDGEPGAPPHVAVPNHPQRLEGKGLQVICKC